jgi:fumarate reductase subunit D
VARVGRGLAGRAWLGAVVVIVVVVLAVFVGMRLTNHEASAQEACATQPTDC